MLIVCYLIAVTILIVVGVICYINRKNFGKLITIMLIGVVIMAAVLIFPVYKADYSYITSVLLSALYALKVLSGGQNVEMAQKLVISGGFRYAYYALLYVAFIIAPIFSVSFLISIFGNLSDKIRYVFIRKRNLHVFSELNESAVLLCESLEKKGNAFVFCNTKLSSGDKDTDLVRRLRAVGAIIVDTSELSIKIRNKKVDFYQITNNKDRNTKSTIELIEKYRETDKNIRITTFTSGITSELLLDSVDKGQIIVKLIDEIKYSCYAHLDQVPLFQGAKDHLISALIVGCDSTGMEMLKAMTWCGQIVGYKLEINVIDIIADVREKEFLRLCPGINLQQYGINFIKADAKTADFEDALKRFCKNTTYAVIMTDDDRTNIETAIYLRKYFLQNDAESYSNKPVISLRVRDPLKSKRVESVSANDNALELHAFGSLKKTFCVENVLGSTLEKLAVGVHLAYFDALNGTAEEIRNAMSAYYIKEYNQRASFASALHFKYKMFACGIDGLCGQPVSSTQIAAFEECLKDETVVDMLAMMEHERWNAFMRTEGYVTAPVEAVKHYKDSCHLHINHLAKLHPSIVEWDQLDKVSEEIGSIMRKPFDFKKSDYDIVHKIPDILRVQYLRSL